jgi:hypothetical protein
VHRRFYRSFIGKKGGGMEPRKGLKRKYFFAVPGKKDWSGKPGFRRFEKAPEMRPKKADKNFYACILCQIYVLLTMLPWRGILPNIIHERRNAEHGKTCLG